MAEQVNAPITISMALDMRRNRIRIHKPTIHLLGDPTLLQLLFDPEDMVVAIVCRDTEVSGGQEVRINPRGLKSRNCFEFCSSMFLRKLFLQADWTDHPGTARSPLSYEHNSED